MGHVLVKSGGGASLGPFFGLAELFSSPNDDGLFQHCVDM